MDGFTSKRGTGKDTTRFIEYCFREGVRMKLGFCEDFLRCVLMKDGSDMRVFHDFDMHLNCVMVFTGREDRIAAEAAMER